jgi:DNA (cytosine-5)-methyltransferase 1
MEQIRIVKEMRKRDESNGRTGVDIRPRYMVWENVPGAFSSNKGEDFRIVLEELAKIADEDATVPMPPKGKWTTSGCIMGDGWSIAWRVLDAQFWGTSDKPLPQRRRRIALVADFGGESAPEILFVRQSESGNIKPGEQKRKETATDVRGGTEADDCFGFDRYNQSVTGDVTETLRTPNGGDNYPCVCHSIGCDLYNTDITGDRASTLGVNCGMSHGRQGVIEQTLFQPVYSVENHPNDSRVKIDEEGKVQALTSRMGTGGGNVPMVMCYSKQRRAKSSTDFETWKESDTANTLNVFDVGDVRTTEAVVYSVDQGGGKSSVDVREGLSPTLTCTHDGAPVIALDRASFNQGENAKFDFEISDKGVNSTLVAKGPSAVCYSFDPTSSRDAGDYILESVANPLINGTCPGHKNAVCYWDGTQTAGTLTANNASGCQRMPDKENFNCVVQTSPRYIVRRLTPLECERLQGFPDNWTDIGEWVDSTGKKRQTSDAARYKAIANSIALPPWKWVLKRLCACYERDATMASLFDGIGGFPYIWEQLNGKGSCLWASEIEEFPIAVTKRRFT